MPEGSGPAAGGSPRAVIFLGPPGAGKGTQAREVASRFGLPHISTGDMFRDHMSRNTPLGEQARRFVQSGGLVPDEVVLGMVGERISRPDCRGGFVLDGFPRTQPQAEALDETLRQRPWRQPIVVHFVVDADQLLRRLTGRRTCKVGGEIYNIYDFPPKVPGRCDRDGGELFQRPDDREEVIRERLSAYQAQTWPLVEYYRGRGVLVDVNAMGSQAEVTEKVLQVLGQAPVR
jgi:adenylate kinase